jgi:hypothetical protein
VFELFVMPAAEPEHCAPSGEVIERTDCHRNDGGAARIDVHNAGGKLKTPCGYRVRAKLGKGFLPGTFGNPDGSIALRFRLLGESDCLG